jgi:hypothetical protein
MKALLKALAHAAIGGAGVALATLPTGAPITTRNVLLPALVSAATSVISLLAQSPVKLLQADTQPKQ